MLYEKSILESNSFGRHWITKIEQHYLLPDFQCTYHRNVCKLCILPNHLTAKPLTGKLRHWYYEGQTLGNTDLTLAMNFIYSLTVNLAFIHLETRHIPNQGAKKPYILTLLQLLILHTEVGFFSSCLVIKPLPKT